MDPIKQLEFLLQYFNEVIDKCTVDRDELFQPRTKHNISKAFSKQEGDFSVHQIGFHYMLKHPLDSDSLALNRSHALACVKLISKYASAVESCIDSIFVDGAELKKRFIWFPSNVSFEMIEEAIEQMRFKSNQKYFKVRIIEGYIGDGKSALLLEKKTFDSELDYFYRAEIKENWLGASHMPEVFFRVFALLGIYGAMCSSLMLETEFFIDRSWLSHEYFAGNLKSRLTVNYKPPTPIRTFHKCFFATIILWSKLFRSFNEWVGDHVLTEVVEFYFRQTPMERPWPFREHRRMEMDIYKTEDELVKHYKQFYLYLNKFFMECKYFMNNH